MKHEPIFNWDPDTKTASCLLTDYKNHFYSGVAQCHPDDEDMMSEKTGYEIAFTRAKIHALQGYKNELRLKLSSLNQLYYSMKHSTHFNEKSYENKMLQRQIKLINFDITTTQEMIANEQQKLKEYINNKDEFYTKVRNRRKAGNSN